MTCKEFAVSIDDYLRGNLPAEKQEAFELHYFQCDGCFTRLKAAERLHSQEVLIAVESRKSAVDPLNRPAWWTWKPLLVAAALVVVVFSSLFFMGHSRHMKHLYEISAFTPPPYIESETRKPGPDDSLEKAMNHYTRGNYTGALEILERVPFPSENPQVIFFKGICYLVVDDLKKAIREFDRIIEKTDPAYYDEAIYFKAIALLRSDEKEKALEQLNLLASLSTPNALKAKTMISKIASDE